MNKLPMGFELFLIEDEDTIPKLTLSDKSIIVPKKQDIHNKFTFIIYLKNTPVNLSILITIKSIIQIASEYTLQLEWPGILKHNNQQFAHIQIKKQNDLPYLSIVIDPFDAWKNIMTKLCIKLHTELYKSHMLQSQMLINEINKILSKRTKRYENLSLKQSYISQTGDLTIMKKNYKKYQMHLENFICTKNSESN